MRKTVRALSIAISLAAGCAAAGYVLAGKWTGALVSLFWGGLWVSGMLRQASRKAAEESLPAGQTSRPDVSTGTASSALLGYALLVIAGIWSDVWPGWLLVGLAAALAGWDLEYFVNRLRYVRDEAMAAELTDTHLRRLGWVQATGLLLGSAALLVHFRLNFGWAMLVALLAVFGVTRFISFFRQVRSE